MIYARKGADEIGGGTTIENGEKITQELASVSYYRKDTEPLNHSFMYSLISHFFHCLLH